jgi:thiamine monophosphate kinase
VAHLAAASGVRCVVDLSAVPLLAPHDVHDALVSGEEYELLVAAPTLDTAAFRAAHDGLTLTPIGRVDASAHGGGEAVGEQAGRTVPLTGESHDHFAPS